MTPKTKLSHRRSKFHAMLGIVSSASLLMLFAQETPKVEECSRKLGLIDEALRSYLRRNSHQYPQSLTELLEKKYILDQRTLVCPKALASSDYRLGHRFMDASDYDPMTSYQYELTHMTRDFNRGLTDRELRLLQSRSPVGRRVPVVRCFKHQQTTNDQVLNLRMNGDISLGSEYWESDERHIFPHSYLLPAAIQRSQAPLSEQAPKRPRLAYPKGLINLAPYYTGLLTDCWPLDIGIDTLSPLMEGNPDFEPIKIADVLFDARGVVQLDAKVVKSKGPPRNNLSAPMFPEIMRGIKIEQHVDTLYVLHATLFAEEPAQIVGKLEFKFDDESTVSEWLKFGVNTGCWRSTLHAQVENWNSDTRMAWTAPSPVENGNLRLFVTAFNFQSKGSLESIDFISAMSSKAAPFIVAITASP